MSLKPRGPPGWALWAGATVTIMYGFYQVGQGNIERNRQKVREREIRYNIAPLMQAEADREYAQRERAILAKEAEIMKNVPGWEVGKNPYNNGKWMPRAIYDFSREMK